MASSKKQFMAMYDESVQLLRKFKQTNDTINKSIGIQHDSSISLKVRAEQSSHNMLTKKLDQILQKLEQSYLDPDTARKIGTVKQQYKIQKDRRNHLIESLAEKDDAKIPHETSQSQNYIKYTLANTRHYQKSTKNSNSRRRLESQSSSNTTAYTAHGQNEEQVTEFDYEIECKLLKQKNNALKQAEKTLLNVYQIQKDCEEMVNYQGEHIDIISDQIFKAKQNIKEAVTQLKQANELTKRRNKKIFALSLFLILATVLFLGVVLF